MRIVEKWWFVLTKENFSLKSEKQITIFYVCWQQAKDRFRKTLEKEV
ncbi:MAG: hypothetical protein HFG56_02860 [Lachnospiraceae bacterium]|nr:hypothetical protein [Lachnospiraceae bacterium]MCI9282212.1 hypothetical protein [Lachnospiraceae bacterium]